MMDIVPPHHVVACGTQEKPLWPWPMGMSAIGGRIVWPEMCPGRSSDCRDHSDMLTQPAAKEKQFPALLVDSIIWPGQRPPAHHSLKPSTFLRFPRFDCYRATLS